MTRPLDAEMRNHQGPALALRGVHCEGYELAITIAIRGSHVGTGIGVGMVAWGLRLAMRLG